MPYQHKILIIDDTPANLALLGQTLKADYLIQIATSGLEGLELAKTEPPDLILLDIMMPGMDGYETCSHFKNDAALKNIPIIFITALTEVTAESKGLALGAVDYLTKPINIQIAQLRIRNLLDREQMRRELFRQKNELQLAASVFANTHDGIVITDPENRIIDVNQAFTRITGFQKQEVLGKNPSLLKSGRQTPEFYESFWNQLLVNDYWNGELWNRNKSGEFYAALTSISIVRDEIGRIHHFIGLFTDITSQKNHEFDLERIAHFDPLTGIPNRLLLADRLKQSILQCRRSKNFMAVCYVDLDGFKAINDQFGHEVGDQLLIDISQRMKECLRAGDTLARIGGDEFVFLLINLNEKEECEAVLERILRKIAEPLTIENLGLAVSASLGYTIFPNDEVDADTLLRHADQAMYVAKQAGKNRSCLFDPKLDRIVTERNESIARIEAGLHQEEFELFYQPKVNMHTGEVIGVEALIRWNHPNRGVLLPSEFLPLIENHELIDAIGEWVIHTAFQHIKTWQDSQLHLITSINVAPHHLLNGYFVDHLKKHLADFPSLCPGDIELEILETAMLENIYTVSKLMNECRALGIKFAMDDFGTGYSSLTYLRALPAETLKIDQSFVRDMLVDTDALTIVEGIIHLSKTFHRKVIAEGVETLEQSTKLLELGCEHAQGYYYARPMPIEKFLLWMGEWNKGSGQI